MAGQTLGVKINNPFCIKGDPKDPWKGSVGLDKLGHAVFGDVADSVRAVCRILARYSMDGRRSLDAITKHYAPTTDGNDPKEYSRWLAARVGVTPHEDLGLFADGMLLDGWKLMSLLAAIAWYESRYDLTVKTAQEGIQRYERDFVR